MHSVGNSVNRTVPQFGQSPTLQVYDITGFQWFPIVSNIGKTSSIKTSVAPWNYQLHPLGSPSPTSTSDPTPGSRLQGEGWNQKPPPLRGPKICQSKSYGVWESDVTLNYYNIYIYIYDIWYIYISLYQTRSWYPNVGRCWKASIYYNLSHWKATWYPLQSIPSIYYNLLADL